MTRIGYMSISVFRTANKLDAEAIARLVNQAYQPKADAAGWTHEADLVDGGRTSVRQVAEIIAAPDSLMLVGLKGLEVVACVHVEREGKHCHIGMFAVNPALQGAGVGKQLLAYAEEQASLVFGAQKLVMFVLAARTELIAYYLRRGYQKTGVALDYTQLADAGKPKLAGLKVEVLEKQLNNNITR